MDHLAIQILAFVKANPGWAIFVIGLTAFGESFVFLSLLFPGTAILIAAGTLISEGILNPFRQSSRESLALFSATWSRSGSARDLDLFFQKFGPSEGILNASRAALAFLSAMVLAAFSSGDSLARYARLFPWRLA